MSKSKGERDKRGGGERQRGRWRETKGEVERDKGRVKDKRRGIDC